MFGGRSFLKRRASSIARKHTPTRHFPTRKTTRTALKTTLSIKRARKIQPHIPDLPLNLAPFLPRGAHIFGFFRYTRKSKKQKTKEKQKKKITHHFFLTVRGELHRRSLRLRHARRSRKRRSHRLWFLLLRFQVALERLFVKGFRECHLLSSLFKSLWESRACANKKVKTLWKKNKRKIFVVF